MKRSPFTTYLSAILLSLASLSATAQSGKPIRLVVPVSPGGSLDIYARTFAPVISRQLNQPVVVENVSGAGGNIGVAQVARANPDGETLLFHNLGFVTNPVQYRKPPYNPVADFEAVGAITFSTMALAARPDLPVADMKQFITYARANGDKVTIGDGGVGGPAHLCGLLLAASIGTKFTHVSFKGAAPGLQSLMGGQIDVMCDGTTSAARPIAAGKLKGLGVTTRTRLPALPDLPTLAESGATGYEFSPWSAVLAPKNTPRPAIQRMEAALAATLADKDILGFFEKSGLSQPPRDLATSTGLQGFLKDETERWSTLFRKAGLPFVD